MVPVGSVLDIDPAEPVGLDTVIRLSECAPGLADPCRIIEQFDPHPDGYLACRVEFLGNPGARHCDIFRRFYRIAQDLYVSLKSAFIDGDGFRFYAPGPEVFAMLHILRGRPEMDNAVRIAVDHILTAYGHDVLEEPGPSISGYEHGVWRSE